MDTAEKDPSTRTIDNEGLKAAEARDETLKRISIIGAITLTAFLIGFIPMWLSYRSLQIELRSAQNLMRPLDLRNDLATAAIKAGRGEYEEARQLTSEFFTSLRAESELETGQYAGDERRESVDGILQQRDEVITLLARNDPAAAARLVDLYYELIQMPAVDTTK